VAILQVFAPDILELVSQSVVFALFSISSDSGGREEAGFIGQDLTISGLLCFQIAKDERPAMYFMAGRSVIHY